MCIRDRCKDITISNNLLYDISTAPGFGGCAAITAYFTESLAITHNHIEMTAYNGINLGWGWKEFKNSTTAKNNIISYNRIINTLRRLHDSGAIYTIGQNPGTCINQNYIRGIPAATSGPTYGLHNDEGSAYITENDNVLDIDPGVKYTINCEDFGDKHHLTILRTYATVRKMGANPPNSIIDPPVVISDNVWPLKQYNNTCVLSGIQDTFSMVIPEYLILKQDYVFPASCAATAKDTIKIRSSGDPSNTVWFARSGTTTFAEGSSMTNAPGNATSITAPRANGTYKLFIVNSQGKVMGESAALLRIIGGTDVVQSTIQPEKPRFITTISKGQLFVKHLGEPAKYTIAAYMTNGQVVFKSNTHTTDPVVLPVKTRGLYIALIHHNGNTIKNVITYY
jgi:hypothetical protein